MTYSEHHLGSVIRKYRKERGFTQAALAEKIGLTQRQVMYIENSQSFPKYETLCKIIDILSIPPDHLFRPLAGDDDENLSKIVELLHSCPPDDQTLVYATLRTLIEQLKKRH